MKKFKRSTFFLLLTLLILFVTLVVWAIARDYDDSRAAYIDTLMQPDASFPLGLKWQVDLGRSTYERPIFQGGLVLMPADGVIGSRWYGIDAHTGQVSWRRQIDKYSFLRCLTAETLVLSGHWSFIALKAHNGAVIWEKERAQTASCSEEVVFYNEVPAYSIQAADLSTGKKIWSGTEPRKSFSGLIYNSKTKEILAKESTLPENMYIIDPSSGLLTHSFDKVVYAPEDGRWQRGPMYLIDEGELFLGGTVLNAETGEVIHKEEHYDSNTPPTVTADTMYLSARFEGVVAFDRATYDIKWIYQLQPSDPLNPLAPVAISDGVGYVIFSDATLRAFDLETGQELGYWQPSTDDLWNWRVCTFPSPRSDCIESARAGLAASDDRLFVSFGDGKLYAFSK